MEYNDLIIIILLVVLIMTILFKYDVVSSKNLKVNPNNEVQQNSDNLYYNREHFNTNKKKILSHDSINNKSNRNNKTYRNNLDDIEVEVEEHTENTNMPELYTQIYLDNKTKNKSILKKSSNKKMSSEIANSIYNKQNIKSNNKKVIIDDYSEMENIKSLNSMDNTLSDIMSTL